MLQAHQPTSAAAGTTRVAHACVVVGGPAAPVPGVGVALGVWGAGCLALGTGAGVARGSNTGAVIIKPDAWPVACAWIPPRRREKGEGRTVRNLGSA